MQQLTATAPPGRRGLVATLAACAAWLALLYAFRFGFMEIEAEADPCLNDPQGSLLPPYNLHVPVPDWVAVGLLWLALAVGAGGWWCCRSAAVDGWRPRLARLAALGVGLNVVVCLVRR